jgi:hypothetical protein
MSEWQLARGRPSAKVRCTCSRTVYSTSETFNAQKLLLIRVWSRGSRCWKVQVQSVQSVACAKWNVAGSSFPSLPLSLFPIGASRATTSDF